MSPLSNIPIIIVRGHKIPVAACQKIVEMWHKGYGRPEIIDHVMETTGCKNRRVINEITHGVLSEQRELFINNHAQWTQRGSAILGRSVSPDDARRKASKELNEALAALVSAQVLLERREASARALIRSRVRFSMCGYRERLRRESSIDRQIQHAVQIRQQAEDEVKRAELVVELRRKALSEY